MKKSIKELNLLLKGEEKISDSQLIALKGGLCAEDLRRLNSILSL